EDPQHRAPPQGNDENPPRIAEQSVRFYDKTEQGSRFGGFLVLFWSNSNVMSRFQLKKYMA
ncbi:MAG: hypothetical protein J6W14_04220, partial [Clostridia bacterium]|nr:hypothetical protein [Clostridia bacterium]